MARGYNRYEFTDDYVIGYSSNTNEKFYFDLNKYDLVSKYVWRVQTDKRNGYKRIVTTMHYSDGSIKVITLWKMITGYGYCDHKNGNTLDNRCDNLRSSNHKLNMQNKKQYNNNTSGFIGVSMIRSGNWNASIRKDSIEYNLGAFDKKEDAILARIKAEAAIFDKEYAPNRDLFDLYNIDIEYEKAHWEEWIKQDKVNFLGYPIYNHKREVVQLTIYNEYIAEYKSAREAERITGICNASILSCCKGKQKTSGGYKWMYKEDWDKLQSITQN